MNRIVMSLAAASMLAGLTVSAVDAEKELAKFAPESKGYKTVYAADALSGMENGSKKYSKDNSAAFAGKKFKKVAYYMHLVGKDGKVSQVFVTMDPFTQNVKEIGVPVDNPAKAFQVQVNNMTVKSNVAGVKNGTFPKGNIEFWATNYGGTNSAKVPGASEGAFDFGDQPTPGNYGSMQIHNFGEKQTVMAYNMWRNGKNADIGIGNAPSGQPDWTFSNNGKNLKSADLLVLVQE